MKPAIEIKLLNEFAQVPRYQTSGSAGMDIHAAIEDNVVIYPGRWALINSGLAININDPGMVAVLASRSGLALNNGIKLGNGIGICDSDYQKAVGVILHNTGVDEFVVHRGDRIAQLMFVPVHQVNLMLVSDFTEDTGRGGFGSTGSK